MWRYLLVAFLVLCCVNGATAQTPLQPTVPGDAAWTARTFFQTNGTARYSYIPQSLEAQEWTSLGSTITVEFWVNPSSFPSDPEGKWDPSYLRMGETQYLPILSRHPGFGFENQWAHFFTEFIRLPAGLVLVVYSGCGCKYEPMIDNGRQFDLYNCGYGYILNSDNPRLAVNNSVFIFPTETWSHVAFSLDGDNTDVTKSKMGHLYVNGKLLFTNRWADPGNQGVGYNKTSCVDKPMQWFRSTGLMNTMRMGFFQNQDFNEGRVVNNLDPRFNFYGFNGTIDELRIWKVVRSPQQIADYYDVALSKVEISDPSLVAYYKFNEGPVKGPNPNFVSAKGFGDPIGVVVTNDPSLEGTYRFWNGSQTGKEDGLIINPKVFFSATLINTPRPVVNKVVLPSFDANGNNVNIPVFSTSFQPYTLSVVDYSPSFANAIQNGTATLTFSDGTPVPLNTPFPPSTELNVILQCVDTFCSNLGGTPDAFPWRSFYFSYQAQGVVPSNLTARLLMNVYADCDGAYDACGVCNGDNRTCQCVYYHDFTNVRMSYVLLNFLIDFLITKVTTTTQLLQETLDRYIYLLANLSNLTLPDPSLQTSQLTSFYNQCLSPYCKALSRFETILSNIPNQQ